MPLKLNNTFGTVPDRITRVRATIKDGEGWTMEEVAEHPWVCASPNQVRSICQKRKWLLKNYDPNVNRVVLLLVNARELKRYADKSGAKAGAAGR